MGQGWSPRLTCPRRTDQGRAWVPEALDPRLLRVLTAMARHLLEASDGSEAPAVPERAEAAKRDRQAALPSCTAIVRHARRNQSAQPARADDTVSIRRRHVRSGQRRARGTRNGWQ